MSVSRTKRVLFISVLFLLPFLLITAVEGLARGYVYARYGVPGKTYGLWRSDEVLGAQQLENGYNTIGQTNNFGFRNDEDVWDPKPPNSLRIIAYGGSTTYCYNLLQHETWPYRLEQIFRSRWLGGEKDQVLNAGGVAWSLGHVYARAKKDIPLLKPDYVLIYSGLNEALNASMLAAEGVSVEELVKRGRYGVFATNLDQNSWIKRNLFTYKVLAKYALAPLSNLTAGGETTAQVERWPSQPDPYILKNYLIVLDEFLGFLERHGAKAVFIIQINGDNSAKNNYLVSYSRAGAEVAKRHHAIVIDPRPVVEEYQGKPMDLFYHTGVHYSEFGARRFAEFVFRDWVRQTQAERANVTW
jgi:hypothetical protein